MATKAVWGTYKKELGKGKQHMSPPADLTSDHSRLTDAVKMRRRTPERSADERRTRRE